MTGLPAATAIHPRLYRLANAGLPKLWAAGLSPPADLDPARLFTQARAKAGLDDFGADDGWRERLAILLEALTSEARLNPIGLTIAHGTLINRLADRLRLVEWKKRKPDVFQQPLSAPVIICGHMRSGTTRLQRLLACDDRFQHMRLFETLSPVPPLASPDRRMIWARFGLRFIGWANPGTQHAHPTAALEADEETGLLEFTLWGAQIEAQRRVPSFARHCETADATAVYQTFADLLRLIGWHRGHVAATPWLLKSPQYLQDLPALTAALPGARLVFVSRAPAALVASGCSLVWNQMVVQSDEVDPLWIGREWLAKTKLREARARDFAKRYPAHLQFRTGFEAMDADWRCELRRLYDFLDLELTPALLARMEDYLARAAREHSHTRHRYRLSDFGVSEDEAAAALS